MALKDVKVKFSADTTGFHRGLKLVQGGLASITKTVAALAGVTFGLRTLSDFISTAARTETLNVAMRSVARSSGYAYHALSQQKKAVMELGIAEQEATQILTRFMQAQLDIADAAKIARVAQDAAVIAGMNSSQAAEQMTEAIAKQRPELLTVFGMTRNLNSIYDEYAKTVNKTVKQLTEYDKKQAMVNYILSEGERIAGTYEASMGTVGKQIGSLPRLYDTLKNALAAPLALPAVSTVIEGITRGLKSAIAWAEVNRVTLQRWGQTAANVAGVIIQGFRWVTQTLANNWAMIRFVVTAWAIYTVGMKVATGATAAFNAIQLALKGQLAAKIPILGLVSTAVGIYKVQMALAAQSGIVLTGALAKLRVALYAVQTALGPIGWALIVISLLVAGGMALWDKYTKSLQQVPKISNNMTDSIKGTTRALRGQTEAMLDAANIAQKSLLPLDEINRIGETSGPVLPDLPSLAMPEIEIPEINWDEMTKGFADALEGAKPSFTGFLNWIWDGWSDWVQSWDLPWLDSIIDFGISEWNKWWPVAEKLFTGDWEGLWEELKRIYAPIGLYLGLKFGEAWNNVQEWWNSTKVGQFFGNVRTGITDKFKTIPDWFKNKFSDAWTRVKNVFSPGGDVFRGIKEGIANTFKTVVNALIRGINTIIRTPFNTINSMLNKIRGVSVLGVKPFQNLWKQNPLPVPQIPQLAAGGHITGPVITELGETRQQEVVIPLERDSGWADILAEKIRNAGGAGGANRGQQPPIINQFYIGRRKVFEEMNAEAKRQNIRAGRAVAPVGG